MTKSIWTNSGRVRRNLAIAGLATLSVAACGGGSDVEFTATDAEGLAAVIDSAVTEDSGMKGLIGADAFGPADVEEFNGLAEDACQELAKEFGTKQLEEFTDGIGDGASELDSFLDVEALLTALVDETCPGNSATLRSALDQVE